MLKKNETRFSISIVSHGHRSFVIALLEDLAKLHRTDIEVILTWNQLEEETELNQEAFDFPIISIHNSSPKGFAANHNYAFTHSNGNNFVILNPDIRMPKDPFPFLISILNCYSPCICAPLIENSFHKIEDSARYFPSPFTLFQKAAEKILHKTPNIDNVPENQTMLNPDWIAGMFMVIPNAIYKKLSGLSERYYLYYEDVDFCARARQAGVEIFVSKLVTVVHLAQRKSHSDKEFFQWHIKSAIKFFGSKAYINIMRRRTLNSVKRLFKTILG